MKIGIVTICDSLNYGTPLQAFALYNILSERYNADVSLILNEAAFPICRDLRFIKRRRVPVLIKKANLVARFKCMERTMKRGSINDKYDIVIVGSDELWNVNNKDLIHDGLFMAQGLIADTFATYAVSSNGCNKCDIQKRYGDNPLKRFDYLSVRDFSTNKMVQEYGRGAECVLDPTFLFDFNRYVSEKKKDIVLVYSYGFLDEEVRQIIEFSQKVKMPIVAIGNDFRWCSRYVGGDPFTFVDYIKNASYFITSTFHGSAIAIQMHANFVSLARKNRKVSEILEEFGLSCRDASRYDLETIYEKKINYEKIDKLINEKKQTSFEFLDRVMNRRFYGE